MHKYSLKLNCSGAYIGNMTDLQSMAWSRSCNCDSLKIRSTPCNHDFGLFFVLELVLSLQLDIFLNDSRHGLTILTFPKYGRKTICG